jgi:NAD(P)H-flavin reductase
MESMPNIAESASGLIPNSMIPVPYRVRAKRKELSDTFTIEIKPEQKNGGISFIPGQFMMLYVFGLGEVPISISGDPAQKDRLVHTVRIAGAVSNAICSLKRAETLGVRGPFGNGWPVEDAKGKDIVIVAGGIGLAPLRPAIYQILANRDHYGKVTLLYGARTPDAILYREELEKWRGRLDIQVEVTVDLGTGTWRGDVGVVPGLIPFATFNPANAMAFICGPEVMMRFTIIELLKRGLEPNQIIVSMERNMKCAIGLCGHCQFGPMFVCKDGPVFSLDRVGRFFGVREF